MDEDTLLNQKIQDEVNKIIKEKKRLEEEQERLDNYRKKMEEEDSKIWTSFLTSLGLTVLVFIFDWTIGRGYLVAFFGFIAAVSILQFIGSILNYKGANGLLQLLRSLFSLGVLIVFIIIGVKIIVL